MAKRNKAKVALFIIAAVLGIASVFMSFFGLPGTMDTEPPLAVAVACLGIAGLLRD
jgi:hypothetical protein